MSRRDEAADQMPSRSDGWWCVTARYRQPSNEWTSAWHPLEWYSMYARLPRQLEHQRPFVADLSGIRPSVLRYHRVRTGAATCLLCARGPRAARLHPCSADPARTTRPFGTDPTKSVALYADAPEMQEKFYPRRSERPGPPACQP